MFISFLIEWCLEALNSAQGCASACLPLGTALFIVAIYVTLRQEQGRKDSDPLKVDDITP
ncbi:unnamed protein product [marine sediment metagenome]|uniref:Uncharacterized protein n=1 Tax=marine sediment metagenome TaxID=412755 RepID=X0ZB37_9ZZZZ